MAMQKNLWTTDRRTTGPQGNRRTRQKRVLSVVAIAAAFLVGSAAQGLAQTFDTVPPLPAGAMPVPSAALPPVPTPGQQYLIYVHDTSEATLRQVRQVEPTAFRTTFQGRSVIQAGRFNMTVNAQQRMTDLAARGVASQMAQVAAAVPSFAQSRNLPANVYAASGGLPPLPDIVFAEGSAVPVPSLPPGVAQVPPAPGNVEFGQELNFGLPPAPNTGASIPPPAGAPAAAAFNAPYYVVIPTDASSLATLSSQVIQLGAPAAQVQQRTEPRGAHVAIGPFTDRGLANRWNNFFREAGISNSRVHFQR